MVESAILIAIGFVLLIKGADFLVDGSSNIAKKFHIPEIVIGLTVVSIGTSMPELFVSITSALEGYSDMSIGNVVGSNICNLLLILGLAATIKPVNFKRETRLIEIPICLFVTIIFTVLANVGQDITRVDAIVLAVIFALFIIYTIVMAFEGEKFDSNDEQVEEVTKVDEEKNSTLKNIFFVILGIAALKFGGDLTVNNSVKIAEFFNVSEKIISLTILAVGTILPELVTTVSAAIKHKSDIAIGNIIGSNIFNLLLIVGVSALIKPITYNLSYNRDMIILILATTILTLFPIIPPRNKMSRMNGIIYLILYGVYITSLFV